jgi:cellulose synthase/poly-beta-1,6-N-acetylglucosamine synthase-like glycosyltransferase
VAKAAPGRVTPGRVTPGLVTPGLVTAISLPIILVLLVFNIRRLLFLLAAVAPKNRAYGSGTGTSGRQRRLPDVLILAPCRNEEGMIAGLCQALDGLDYPRECHQVVLIDDGSSDATAAHMKRFAHGKPGWHVLSLPANLGKAGALNAALAAFPYGEIIYVLDADHRPDPSALLNAVRHFDDAGVAGVSGRTVPLNALASPSAFYASVENDVHQLVTMRAKDRLGLAPALLGSNCGYRRAALAECGGFPAGALLEDSVLTLAFYGYGKSVRFAEEAVAYHQVPETVTGYLKQHRRWSRGFNDTAQHHAPGLLRNRRLPLAVRLELFLFAAGYLDRIALAGAAGLAALSAIDKRRFPFPRAVLYAALLAPLAQIAVLFAEQRAPWAMWARLPLIPFYYLLDIVVAMLALADSLLHRNRVWSQTARANV